MHSYLAAAFTTNKRLKILLWSVILISIPTAILSNSKEEILDTSYPILISERYEETPPPSESAAKTELANMLPNSFFGYSVSMAEGKTTPKHPKGWLFIGAPKSNTSNSIKYSKVAETEPGVMWRCSLGRSTSTDFCEMMDIDPPLDSRSLKNGNPGNESHTDAFIGGTSEINHNRFISCGARWKRGGNQFYNGICYWFADKEGSEDTSYRTHELKNLVNKDLVDQRLMPFFLTDKAEDADNKLFSFENLKGRRQKGYEWPLSQAGMSVHLFLEPGVEPSKTTSPNLLIGAPGVRQWSGAVVLYTNARKPKKHMTRSNRNKNDPTFSEFVVLNRGIKPEKLSTNNQEHWYDYFGYSVSAGKYLKHDQVLYAAGAPRSNHTGAVAVFDAPPYQESAHNKRQINAYFDIPAPDNGFGSYFGAVIHSVDYDSDGLDELIVGAPLKTSYGSREGAGDEGCVFVYQLHNVEDDSNVIPVQTLVGSKSPGARFGSAISSLKIESEDPKLVPEKVYLVIGAPFEQAGDASKGVGAIYLYLYNKDTRKSEAFSQRIHASRVSSSLQGFGSSLSLPQDIDENKTPDLAIGAFKSRHAVVLRTRPRMHLTSWMKFGSPEKSEVNKIRRGTQQFFVISCFNVKEIMGLVDLTVDIWTTIRFSDKRIKFDESHVRETKGNTANRLTFFRKVDAHKSETCEKISVLSEMKNGFGMEDSDFETDIPPFKFYQQVWYNGTSNRALSVLNMYAEKLSTKLKSQNFSFSSFDDRLPASQKSNSDASIYITTSDCRDNVCKPNLQVTWSFFHPQSRSHSTSSFDVVEGQEIIMQLDIVNTGETAERPTIAFQWDHLWITESMSGNRWLSTHKCKDAHDSTSKIYDKCILKSYIKKGQSATVEIHLLMGNYYALEAEDFPFVVDATISFLDDHIRPVRSTAKVQFIVPKTLATIRGSKPSDNNVIGGPNSFYVAKLENGTKDDGRAAHAQNHESEVLYASIRSRFTVLVQGASVNETVANFKIPVSWNGKQVFFVRQPLGKLENVQCHPTSSKYSFHKIEVITPGASPDTARGGRRIGKKLLHDQNLESQGDPSAKLKRERRDTGSDQVSIAEGTNQTVIREARKGPEIALESRTPTPPPKQPHAAPPSDALEFGCTSETDCLDVSCSISNLKADDPVHIPFEMFPIKESVDTLLKATGKSALYIEATGSVDIFPAAQARQTYHDGDTAEVVLKKITGKVKPWVYVAASGGGILLLILIILGLFKCGFFKREKLEELNHLKAEHHRKSMIAAARASMMVMQSANVATTPNGGGGCESRENLTEAEVHNEDTDVVKPPVTKGKHVEFSAPSYKELEANDDL